MNAEIVAEEGDGIYQNEFEKQSPVFVLKDQCTVCFEIEENTDDGPKEIGKKQWINIGYESE